MSFVNPYWFGDSEPAFWQRSVITTINSTTGTQDITVSGLSFTPKCAVFVCSDTTTVDSTATQAAQLSVGFTDGTNQNVSVSRSDGGSNYSTRHAADEVLMIINASVPVAEANFDSWLAGGVRINVGANTLSNTYVVQVHLFGGTDLQAEAGTFDTTTSPRTVTTGWEPNAMLFASAWSNQFNDTTDTALAWTQFGFASYDGSTLRQAGITTRSGPTNDTRGGIVNTAPIAVAGLGGSFGTAPITAASGTGFTVTEASGTYHAYLAMNFGGAVEAWAGPLAAPTTTGLQNITDGGVSFTPKVTMLGVGMTTVTGTLDTAGNGATLGFAIANEDGDEMCSSQRRRDASTGANATSYGRMLYHLDHTGTLAFDATYDSMVTGGVRANYSTANGTSRRFIGLFIG